MSSEKRSGSEQSCLQDESVAKKAKKTFGIREHIGVVLSTAATITAAASIKARGDCYGDRFPQSIKNIDVPKGSSSASFLEDLQSSTGIPLSASTPQVQKKVKGNYVQHDG